MTFEAFMQLSQASIESTNPQPPYDDPEYVSYGKLNMSRMNRWLKTYQPTEEAKQQIEQINEPQTWIVITEPWCGDAAHIVPIIYLLSELNSLIHLDIQLRDQEPFLINDYLTNGGKSIPILIVRDEAGKDKAVWGPRPEGAAKLFANLKAANASFEVLKIELQKWYNDDKAVQVTEAILNAAR